MRRNTQPTNPLSRRRFLTGLIGLIPLAAARPSAFANVKAESPAILSHLETVKAQFQPIFDLLTYAESTARAGSADPDTLVKLWDAADKATIEIGETFAARDFERVVLCGLVGKEQFRLACARNLEGFEL